MNMSYDQTTLNNIKQLAKKEYANFSRGYCLPEDHPCHVVNRAYEAICDGAVDCDHFLLAVLPLQPELNTAVWREIFGEEGFAGVRWKECVRCHKPYVPSCNRQRYCVACGVAAKRVRSIEKQRRYRARKREPCRVTF